MDMDATNKTVDCLDRNIEGNRAAMERGFSEQRMTMERGFAEVRKEFRWLLGIYLAGFTALAGMLGRIAGLY